MSTLPPLNALRAFEAAARRGGFAAAAEELNVTPAAVGQQVRHLEELLGVRLFDRDGRGLKLTDRGTAGLDRLSQALNLMGEASAAMRDAPQERALALAVPRDIASTWLAPRLRMFMAENEVAITIHSVDRLTRLSKGEADLAISFGTEPPSAFTAQRLMMEVVTPAAAPGDQSKYRTAADLAGAPLIHDASQPADWQDWLASRGAFGIDVNKGLRVDDTPTALRLASEGAGVALARRTIAEDLFRARRLAPLFPEGDMQTDAGYFLLSNPRQRLSPTASLFTSWLRAEAARFEDAGDEL
jgi:LysR family glycine cleavage system transcriptional activator